MPSSDQHLIPSDRGAREFRSTHWSLVLRAGQRDGADSTEALEKLCRAYWFPLYAFARREGCGPEEAQDLTQEFFSRLLAKNYLQAADPQRGRFRSFLLASFRHMMANERRNAAREKRGGGQVFSLDEQDAEGRYLLEPADATTPERIFERRWAETVLARVLDRLVRWSGAVQLPGSAPAQRTRQPAAEVRRAGRVFARRPVAPHRRRHRPCVAAQLENRRIASRARLDGPVDGAGEDATVELRDARTGELRAMLAGHEVGMTTVAFSPDGRTLATLAGPWMKLWHLPTLREVGSLCIGGEHLAFSRDGTLLIGIAWNGTAVLLRAPQPETGHAR